MMKRLLAILLAITLCVSPISVLAADTSASNDPPSTMTGYLTDDLGNVIPVYGKLIETSSQNARSISEDNDEHSATYEFTLYSDTRASSDSLTTEETDGSASVTVYLTIKYTKQNTPTEVLLTKVSGNWKILDSSVSVTSASVTYACSGAWPEATEQQKTKSVSNNFSFNTGFSKYIVLIHGQAGADLTLNLKMTKGNSSRTWSFKVSNRVGS